MNVLALFAGGKSGVFNCPTRRDALRGRQLAFRLRANITATNERNEDR
jgi:hypothetical protein